MVLNPFPRRRLAIRTRSRRLALALVIFVFIGGFLESRGACADDSPRAGNPHARNELTYDDLFSGSSRGPVDDAAFARPPDAAPPTHVFEGGLRLIPLKRSGGHRLRRNSFRLGDSDRIFQLPALEFKFVQAGGDLIPVDQGLIVTGDDRWNCIVGAGRVWSETSDKGFSRASFPFALNERNQNCLANGVMTFLFNEREVSGVRYQITQETCMYFKFDLWGQAEARYVPKSIANADEIEADHRAEVARRLPTKPISAIGSDFPGSNIDLSAFADGVSPEHLTAYGVIIAGTHYIGPSQTRTGAYTYPESMRLPSYSTAKSAFAAVALMRLCQIYGPEVAETLIVDAIAEAGGGREGWADETFEHALDMTTGRYRSAGYMDDERDSLTGADFFRTEPAARKLAAALVLPHRAEPGTVWVYHTTDTFVLIVAMDRFLKAKRGPDADIFDLVRDDVYIPLGLSAGMLKTLRTGNSPSGVPFGGYGLYWTTDDIAKMALFLGPDGGKIGGKQILHPAMLRAAMQRDPNDRGLEPNGAHVHGELEYRYNNGLWAAELPVAGPGEDAQTIWVSLMIGYGGIIVATTPDGAVYYHFSDNAQWDWAPAVRELTRLGAAD